ncbi:MAG TPA: hypothetical protein VII45_07925 [Solirubrobacterales bacterium]
MDDADDTRTTAGEDAEVESAILIHLLAIHPIQITIEELAREIDDRPEDFARRDALERAVRDLVGVGLLHRRDSFVMPSHASIRFDELLGN